MTLEAHQPAGADLFRCAGGRAVRSRIELWGAQKFVTAPCLKSESLYNRAAFFVFIFAKKNRWELICPTDREIPVQRDNVLSRRRSRVRATPFDLQDISSKRGNIKSR